MQNKVPLYKMLNQIGDNPIKISLLRDFYSPIQLATDLKALSELGLIEIDWKKKIIHIKFNIEGLMLNKKGLEYVERKTPEYMKDDMVDINKPFLENKKGEQD